MAPVAAGADTAAGASTYSTGAGPGADGSVLSRGGTSWKVIAESEAARFDGASSSAERGGSATERGGPGTGGGGTIKKRGAASDGGGVAGPSTGSCSGELKLIGGGFAGAWGRSVGARTLAAS